MKNFRLKSKYTELNLNYSLAYKQPKVHSEEELIPPRLAAYDASRCREWGLHYKAYEPVVKDFSG
jgi:hypothetical protein